MSITYNYRTGTITATTFSGALSGNATTASSAAQWTTTRTINMTGDVSSDAVNIDGSGNITITNTAVANDSHTHGAANLTGTTLAAGVTASSLTSVGTLTALQVDNININLNTISSTAGTDLNITPLAGQQIVLDGTIVVDAGVVTGATSISSTEFAGGGSALTSLTAANISAGSLATGVNSYFTASTAASNFKVPFMNYTGTASTNAGLLHDDQSTFTYNPSTNTLSAGVFSGSGASLTSLTAANISSGNLGSGVVPYATASATSSAYKVAFVNTTADASGNFGTLFDSGTSEFTYNPSTNTLTAAIANFTTVTATTIGGITATNLVDKSATETITGTWSFDGSVTESDFGTGAKVKDGTDVLRPVGMNVMPVYEIDANDSFDLAHSGMLWHKDLNAAVTFTCDNDATIPQGACWVVHNDDTEALTIAQGTGVTVYWTDGSGAPTAGNVTVDQGGLVTVYKYTDTEFWVWGAKTSAGGSDFGADGTMDSGTDLAWADASQPWLTLDSASAGDSWSAQGAGISVGESGKKGSAAIHMTYNGDGSGYVGMGTVDDTATTGGRPAFGHLDFSYNNNIIGLRSQVNIIGTSPYLRIYDNSGSDYVEFAHDGTDLNITDLNTTDINITGMFLRVGSSIFTDGSLVANGTGGDNITISHDGTKSTINNLGSSVMEFELTSVVEAQVQDSDVAGNTSGLQIKDHGQTLRDGGFNDLATIEDNPVSVAVLEQHMGGVIYADDNSGFTVSLPTSTASFPVGGVITIINANTSGNITVSDPGASYTLFYLDGTTRTDVVTSCTVGPGGVATVWRQASTGSTTPCYLIWGSGITA